MLEVCIFLAGIGLGLYLVFSLASRGKSMQSAIGATVMVLFLHTYGLVFDWVRQIDLIQIETYNFLPFFAFVGIYLAWITTGLNAKKSFWVWKFGLPILGGLLLFNVVKAIPVEYEKISQKISLADHVPAEGQSGVIGTPDHYPDIYYLIFDEAAGFEAIRQYWQYPQVDEFVGFLKSKGFYIAENSHAHTIRTLYEIASRLNFEQLPTPSSKDEYYKLSDQAISQNKVMIYLKDLGYQLVAYDERRFYQSTLSPMPVDHLVEESPSRLGELVLDDYQVLVLENSLMRDYVRSSGQVTRNEKHRALILYSIEAIHSSHIASPKFVYVHLFLPHVPFIFLANGDLKMDGGSANWQKYMDNYKFFLTVAQKMVDNIISNSEPGNPPVIILSSDHGARNNQNYPYTQYLENYPNEFKTLIVNALYLPGCEDAPLSQDMDPINTFPIIFNCYFNTEIPLN
jgi:hypothetical protein